MNTTFFILFPLVLFTSTFSGVFGMAGGMILMAGLLLHYGPIEAILIHGILQFFANFQRYYQLRQYVNVRILGPYTVGSFLAFVFLSYVDFSPSRQGIYIFMGFSALVGVFQMSFSYSLRNKFISTLAGFFISALQIAGVSGPILDILCQDKKLSRYEIVALKSAAISVSHVLKVFFMFQLMNYAQLSRVLSILETIFLLVAVYGGTLIGKKILDRISDKNFFRSTSTILFFLATYYFYRAST